MKALETLAIDVWYDAALTTGMSFGSEINERARSCRAMVVCWTRAATASHWVSAEAELGRTRQVLAPVLLEQVELAIPFNAIQTESLIDWSGEFDHPGFMAILARLEILLDRPTLSLWARCLASQNCAGIQSLALRYPDDPLAPQASQFSASIMAGEYAGLNYSGPAYTRPSKVSSAPTRQHRSIGWRAPMLAAMAAIGIGGFAYQASPSRIAPPAMKESTFAGGFEELRRNRGGSLSASEIRIYIQRNPSAGDLTLARARLEQLDQRAWKDALAVATPEGFKTYLDQFPPDAEPKPLFVAEAIEALKPPAPKIPEP